MFKEVMAGDTVFVKVNIYRSEPAGKIDLPLTYTIRDENGSIVSTKTATVAVETRLSDIGKIKMPKDAVPGTYLLEVEAAYPGQEKASEEFRVIESEYKEKTEYGRHVLYLIILISMLVAFAGYLVYKLILLKKRRIRAGRR